MEGKRMQEEEGNIMINREEQYHRSLSPPETTPLLHSGPDGVRAASSCDRESPAASPKAEPHASDDNSAEKLTQNGKNPVGRVKAMYEKYAPNELSKVDKLLSRFVGKEESLLEALIVRFGPEPCEACDTHERIGEDPTQTETQIESTSKVETISAAIVGVTVEATPTTEDILPVEVSSKAEDILRKDNLQSPQSQKNDSVKTPSPKPKAATSRAAKATDGPTVRSRLISKETSPSASKQSLPKKSVSASPLRLSKSPQSKIHATLPLEHKVIPFAEGHPECTFHPTISRSAQRTRATNLNSSTQQWREKRAHSPEPQTDPECTFHPTLSALGAKARATDISATTEEWIGKREQLLKQKEERELSEAKQFTFSPKVSSVALSKPPRTFEQYVAQSQQWVAQREKARARLSAERERSLMEELDHAKPVTSEASTKIAARMEQEKKRLNIVAGWAERMKEHNEKMKELEKKYQPSFSPSLSHFPKGLPINKKDADISEGPDRLFRLAERNREKKEEKLEQERRTSMSPQRIRSEDEIQRHIVAMLRKGEDSKRRLKLKAEKMQKEAETFDYNFKPTISPATVQFAEHWRARAGQRAKSAPAPTREAESAQKPKTRKPISQEFFARSDVFVRRKEAALRRAAEARQQHENAECTFQPQISNDSRRIAEVLPRHTYADPTSSVLQRRHVDDGEPEYYSLNEMADQYVKSLGAGKHQSPSPSRPTASSPASSSAYPRIGQQSTVSSSLHQHFSGDRQLHTENADIDTRIEDIEATIAQWRELENQFFS